VLVGESDAMSLYPCIRIGGAILSTIPCARATDSCLLDSECQSRRLSELVLNDPASSVLPGDEEVDLGRNLEH